MTIAGDIIQEFRRTIRDVDPRCYMWSDETVLGYLDQAQQEFWKIFGGMPYVFEAEFGDSNMLLVPKVVLKINEISDDGKMCCGLPKFPIVSHVSKIKTNGFIRENGGYMWYSKRNIMPPLGLKVHSMRLPRERLTSLDTEIETHYTHHHIFIPYMMHKAYLYQDVEGFDRSKIYELMNTFERYAVHMKGKYLAGSMIQL